MSKINILSEIPLMQNVRVIEINMPPNIKRRLMDLGMVKGSIVKPVLKSPAGDPIAYEIKGATIALRNSVASGVLVEVENP